MTEIPRSPHGRAVLMLSLASLYWGLSFPVIKAITALNHALLPGAGTWFLAAAAMAPRFMIAAALLAVFRRRGGARVTPLEWRQGLILGAFSTAGTLLQTDGMQFTDASTSSFLTQFSAILIPAWVALRRRHNPGALVWLCCALVLAGVGVLGHIHWGTLRLGRGEWETLLCSVFFMGQILGVENRKYAGNRPAVVTLIMFAVQGAAFLALAVGSAPSPHALLVPWASPAWVGLTLVLALVCTVAAFTLMTRWQPRITSTEAGLIYCAEPLFASVFTLFLPALISGWAAINYPNERATFSLIMGGGLITLANILVQLKAMKTVKAI